MIKSESYGLYVHIPFCASKCRYCDFYSIRYDDKIIDDYVQALIKEIITFCDNHDTLPIDTIYFGGGTPSILPIFQLEKIVKTIYANFKHSVKEFTIEVNPSFHNEFIAYKDLGINRISMGVQSLDDEILKLIGRRHDKLTALRSLEDAKKVFDNVSADLILGLPKQTKSGVQNDINTLSKIVKHISAYALTVSENVPMAKDIKYGIYTIADDDEVAEIYDSAVETLDKNGFIRYEISNFSLPDYESKHNLKYWERVGYYAFGASAHAYFDNRRYYNPSDIDRYVKGENVGNGGGGITELTKADSEFEEIMLRLRLTKGLDVNKINKEFGIDFYKKYDKVINKLKEYLIIEEDALIIRPEKMFLESAIAREFLI